MPQENTADAKKVLTDRLAVLNEKHDRVSKMTGKEDKAKRIAEKIEVVKTRLADLDKPQTK